MKSRCILPLGIVLVVLAVLAHGRDSGFRQRARALASTEQSKTAYLPVTKLMLEGQALTRFVYGGVEYAFLSSPSVVINLAGGPVAAAESVTWDAFYELVKNVYKHPEKVSRGVANEAYEIGLNAYRENYRLSSKMNDGQELTEAEAMRFVINHHLIGYLAIGRELFQDTTTYERKGTLKNPDIALAESLQSQAIEATRKQFAGAGALQVKALLKLANANVVVLESVLNGRAGLGAYPPYLSFLEKVKKLDAELKRELAELQGSSGENQKVRRVEGSLDLVLVIDSSGSMRQNDPHQLRIRASELLIELAGEHDLVTVIDFDDKAKFLAEGEHSKEKARAAVSRIDADGGTNIGAGLQEALESLVRRASPVRKGVVLLTDGVGDYKDETATFLKNGWPVFTVGLSGQVNETLLSSIASQTGGLYFRANDAAELQQLFQVIHAKLSDQALVAFSGGTIKQGETKEHEIIVDSSLKTLTVGVQWPGSEVRLSLVSPDGRTMQSKAKGKTYALALVDAPASGRWRALLEGISTRAAGEPYQVTASGSTELRLELAGVNRAYRPGERAILTVPVVGLNNVSGLLQIRNPDGSRRSIKGSTVGGELTFDVSIGQGVGDYQYTYFFEATRGAGEKINRAGMGTLRVSGAIRGAGEGEIVAVSGSYVTVNLGSSSMMRPGVKVLVFESTVDAEPEAEGFVTEVHRETCVVELQIVRAIDLQPGLKVKVDPQSWQGDTPR